MINYSTVIKTLKVLETFRVWVRVWIWIEVSRKLYNYMKTSPSPLLFGEYYHIFNRGNNREDIFLEERNYVHFLRLYEKYILPVAKTYAYCLLKNHFHLLVKVRTEEEIQKNLKTLKSEKEQTLKAVPNQTLKVEKTFRVGDVPPDYLSRSFSNFFNAYSKAINNAYGRVGALFQHPFGRVLIKDEPHLINVIAYIHKNPQKHHFVTDYRSWKYSSYFDLVSDEDTFICRQAVLDCFGGRDAFIQLQDRWVEDAAMRWISEKDD
jgi:putative transposase